MKSFNEAVDINNETDQKIESLAFSDNSLVFKFIQNIDTK